MKTSVVVVLAENAEDNVEVFGVLSGVLGEDEDIVEEDNNEVIEVGTEDVIHGALKRSWCVGETEGHDFELVVTVASTKSCFGNVVFSHTDLPVARFEVNFGEDRGTLKTIEEFLCAWNGVSILDGLLVEGAEVDAEAKGTSFLANEKNWRAVW